MERTVVLFRRLGEGVETVRTALQHHPETVAAGKRHGGPGD